MFQRRKRRNQYLLDVKVHHRGRIKQRARAGAVVLCGLLLAAGVGTGLYWSGKWAIHRLVFQHPHFALAEIHVESNGVLTRPLILQLTGVRRGQNIFSVDLDRAKQNLAMIPMVQRAEVRREMPNRLFIHVEERVPVARLYATGQSPKDLPFYLDRAGVVFKPVALSDGSVLDPVGTENLPVLTGVEPTELRVGKEVDSRQVYRALELLEKLDQTAAGTLLEVSTIHVGRPRELSLITKQRMVVRLSTEDFSSQLRRLVVILTWAEQRRRPVQMVDLTVPRGVPVTFGGPS